MTDSQQFLEEVAFHQSVNEVRGECAIRCDEREECAGFLLLPVVYLTYCELYQSVDSLGCRPGIDQDFYCSWYANNEIWTKDQQVCCCVIFYQSSVMSEVNCNWGLEGTQA